ncbi:major facilitator superfamily domain-containing protein [Chiua virens]|nr:major facilitator superfamily domain-containing protein [Chiua virens]
MTPFRRAGGRAEDSVHNREEHSNSLQEQNTLLSSDQEESRLSAEEDEEHALEVSSWKNLPWWKRPSPHWIILVGAIRGVANFAAMAPAVALFTDLACHVHKPEYVINHAQHSASFLSADTLVKASTIGPIPQTSDGDKTVDGIVSVYLPDSLYTASLDLTQIDEEKCASDPVVQAAAAKILAVVSTTVGILSCLTTGWWGSMSDFYGRRIVLFVSALGVLMAILVQILTAWYVDILPGGYWFMLLGCVLDGLCGSLSTSVAMNQSYLADTTNSSTRSRYFSLSLGFLFVGEAIGPVLAGLLIRTTGTVLSAIYFVFILQGIFAMITLLILPESLTRARARGARRQWRKENMNKVHGGGTLDVRKGTSAFLSPLLVLLPERASDANPLERKGRDWSLLCIAIAYGLFESLIGTSAYKLQYAAAQFKWTPVTTSYFISINGVSRAIFLAVILPVIIKYLQPAPIQLSSTPDESLRGADLSASRGTRSHPSSAQVNATERPLLPSNTSAFDLKVARVSMGLEGLSFVGLAVAGTGTLFTLANMVDSLGTGIAPSLESLALAVYSHQRPQNKSEVGKLFGAFSVVRVLSFGICGPALFGFVYANTVAFFPQAFLIAALCATWLALFVLAFVRAPSESTGSRVLPEDGNEESQPVVVGSRE